MEKTKTKNVKGQKGTKKKTANLAKTVREKKGRAEKEAIKKLMNETMSKLTSLATDVQPVPTKKYTGWKLGSRRLASIYPRNLFFHMWIFVYNSSGSRIKIERFEIRPTFKDVDVVVAGLIAQVKVNYCLLKEAKKKASKPKKKVKKTDPKEEAKKEETAKA